MQTLSSVEQRPAGNVATSQDLVPLLLSQVLMTRAIEMARVGRFQEAESLIEGMPGNKGPSALDLMARIRCQQGRLSDAEQLWSQALRHDPNNETFRIGLQQIALRQRRSWLGVSARAWIICMIVVAVVVIAAVVVNRRLDELRNSIISTARSSNVVPGDAGQKETSATQSSTVTVPPARALLAVSGVSTRDWEQGQILTFQNGLFIRGTRLKPEAQQLLTELAHQLRRHEGNLKVQVIGHADNSLPRRAAQSDNVNLGMSRALAVFNYFRQHNLLPSESISVGSFGDADPPFANDTLENRLRNQTVTLRISNK